MFPTNCKIKKAKEDRMEGRKVDNFEKGEKIEKPYLSNLVIRKFEIF
jgi:hypothetical protein